MSKALSDQLRLLRERRNALTVGDLDEYNRLTYEAPKLEKGLEEEEVSTEPADIEPVVEEVSSEEVPSSFPPSEPSSTTPTPLEPLPPLPQEDLDTGEIPGAGSPTWVELSEMRGEGAFRTAFAHVQDFVLENARKGGVIANTAQKEREGESLLGAAENLGIAGALGATGHPYLAAAAGAAAAYPTVLSLSDKVFGTEFGERGTGFGGDPLDPSQWLGGVVFPRTTAQDIQDQKDELILKTFPKNSLEARAAAERLKVTERSDIIAQVVQLNNPGEVGSGSLNDKADAEDFLNAARQMGVGGLKTQTYAMGAQLAELDEVLAKEFEGELDRDEIPRLKYITDLQGRHRESGISLSESTRKLTSTVMIRIQKENPDLTGNQVREMADKEVDGRVQKALANHPLLQGVPIIKLGNDDAILELLSMEERWGAEYGDLGRLAAEVLLPFAAIMTPTSLTQRLGLLNPEQVATESTLATGARTANVALTTVIAGGAKFDYYPIVGPWLARMGIIDPESAVPADPEEVLRWYSEGSDAIDAAPHFARAFYDHIYPDALPGSDAWNATFSELSRDYPLLFQGVPIVAGMIIEPDLISLATGGLGKLFKLGTKSSKLIKLYKYQRVLQEDAIPKLTALESKLEPYVQRGNDAQGNPTATYKDVPEALLREQGELIQSTIRGVLDAAGDEPELQKMLQTSLFTRLNQQTAQQVKEQWQSSVRARRALNELQSKTTKDMGDAEKALGLELRALESESKVADGTLDLTTSRLRLVAETVRRAMPEFFEAEGINAKKIKKLSRKKLQKTLEKATRETQESSKALETVIFNSTEIFAEESALFARLQKQKYLLEKTQEAMRKGLQARDEVEIVADGALDSGKFLRYEKVDGELRAFVQLRTPEGDVVKHFDIKDVAFDFHGLVNKLNPAHGTPRSAAGKRFRDLAKAAFFKETETAFKAADGSVWVPAKGLGSLKEGQTVRWIDDGELKSVEEMTVKTKGTLDDGSERVLIFSGKKKKPGMQVEVPLDQVYTLRHRDAEEQLDGILAILEARARAATMHRGEKVTEEAINAWYARNFKGFRAGLEGEFKPLVEGEELAAQGDALDDIMYQANALRRKTETLKRFGIFPERRQPRTREVGSALQERTRQKYGTIDRKDFSEDAEKKIAKWLVEEVKYGLTDPASPASGAGWYTTAFQQALDGFGAYFPELLKFDPKENPNLVKAGIKSEEGARNFLTALIAVTSDGQKVKQNLKLGLRLYQELRNTGTIPKGTVSIPRQVPLELNIERLLSLLKEHGGKGLETHLLEEFTVKQLKKMSDDPKADFGYEVGFNLPRSAAILGPKLGAFYANLRGVTGYVTMDRWWNRTINRYRGNILPSVTKKSMDELRGLLQKHYKTKKNFSDDEVLIEATKFRKIYKDSDYLDKTDLNVKSNTIWKNAFESLNDSPKGKRDRTFMTKAAKRARNSLKRQGIDLSLADIQAVIWYYEKRLYGEMGARYSGDLNYQDAAATLAQEMEEAGDIGKLLLQKAETPAVPVKPSADTQLLGGVVDMTPGKPSLREQVAAELENLTRNPATAGAATAEEAVEAARLWKELGTESPYFKKWFGDSKIVGEDGKPLVVFHGSRRGGFTEFDELYERHFFAKDREHALTYSGKDKPVDFGDKGWHKKSIYDVYIRLKKPLEVDFKGAVWDIGVEADLGKGIEDFDGIEHLADVAKDRGYDGIIAHNIIDVGEYRTDLDLITPRTEYLVFDNTNIKSTSNRGTFDETGRLLFQGADEPASVDDIVKVLFQDEGAKAAVQFVEDNKAILYAFEQADVSSLLHEIGHVFRRDLLRSGWQGKLDSDVLVRAFTTKDERHIGDTVTFDGGEGVGWTDLTKAGKTRTPEEMDKIQGKRSRKRKAAIDKRAKGLEAQSGPATWTVKSEERFARAFEKYLATGRSPSLELDGVFKKFKSWMTEIYVQVRGSAIGRDIPKEVREVFDRMLTGAMTTEGYMKTFTKNQMMSMLDSKGIVYKSKDKKESLAKLLSAADLNRTAEYRRFIKRQDDMAKQAKLAVAKLAPGEAKLVKSLEDELKPLEAESTKAQKEILKERAKFKRAKAQRNLAKRKLILRKAFDEQQEAEKAVLSAQNKLLKFIDKPLKAEEHLAKQLKKIEVGEKRLSDPRNVIDVREAVKELVKMVELLQKERMVRPTRRNILKHPILKSAIRDRANGTWIIDPKEFVDAVDEFYVRGSLDEFLKDPLGLYLQQLVTAAKQGNTKVTYSNEMMNGLQRAMKRMEDQYRSGHLSSSVWSLFRQMQTDFQEGRFKTLRVPIPFSDMVNGKGVQIGVPGSATKAFWSFFKKWSPDYSRYGQMSKEFLKVTNRSNRFVEHGMGEFHNLKMTHLDGDFMGNHIRYMDTTESMQGRYGATIANTLGKGIFKEAQDFIRSNIKTTDNGKVIFSDDAAGEYTKNLVTALERTFLHKPNLKVQPRISDADATRMRSKVIELMSKEGMTYDKFLRELGAASGKRAFGRQDARGITMASRALLDAAAMQHSIRALANNLNASLTPKEALQMTNFMSGEIRAVEDIDALWSAAAKLGMDLSEGTIRPGIKHGQSEKAHIKSLVRWNLDDGKVIPEEELLEYNAKLEAKLTAQGLTPEQITPLLAVSGQRITDPRQVFMPSHIIDSLSDANRNFTKELDTYYSAPKGFDPQRRVQFLVRLWKGMLTSGLGLPRPKYYVNNMVGDFSQMWQNHGIYTAGKVSAQNVLTNIPYVGPRIQNVTSKMSEKFGGVPVLGTAVEAIFNPDIGRIFKGEEGVIKFGDETVSLSTIRENLALDGVLDTFTAREVEANLHQAALELASDAERQYGRTIPGKVKDRLVRKATHDLNAFATQVQQRQRVGLYLELRNKGLDHEGAVTGVKNALYDWSSGFASWEQGWALGLFVPFYRFWRLAAKQALQAAAEPFVMNSTDYMIKGLTGQTQLARMKTQSRILAGIPKWAAYAEAEEEEAAGGDAGEAFWKSLLAKPWWGRPGMTWAGKAANQKQKDFMLSKHNKVIDSIATAMSSPATAAELYTMLGYVLTTPAAIARAAMNEDEQFNGFRAWKQFKKFGVDIGGPAMEMLLAESGTYSQRATKRVSPGQASALKMLGFGSDLRRDKQGRLVASARAVKMLEVIPIANSQYADTVNGWEWSKLFNEDEELLSRFLFTLSYITGPTRPYPTSTADTLGYGLRDVIEVIEKDIETETRGPEPEDTWIRRTDY